MSITTMKVDRLAVEIYPDRQAMGAAAAEHVTVWMREALDSQEQVCVVFAAAPSQNEFLAALRMTENLDWTRVTALHMDEYIGLAGSHPQSFGYFLRTHLFGHVKPGAVHYLDGTADPESECRRYAALLRQYPVDIVCAGIGENGHLAFNDPPVARFDDPELVRTVTLTPSCRQQQVHDNCFARIEEVPTHALTLTIPALMQARYISCVVPGPTKADAVAQALRGSISSDCPASILRRHAHAVLAVDTDAAAKL